MRVPSHVAAIQDGNRRYAENRGEAPYKGHQQGVETTRALLRWCADIGVDEVTVYALSTENLDRDETELEALFDLLREEFLDASRDEEVHGQGLRIRAVGVPELLPDRVLEAVREAEEATRHNEERLLNVAVGYGGAMDVARAVRETARDAAEGADIADFEEAVGERLLPRGDPVSDVDLLIRTGGEKRFSNFLPWQAAGNGCAAYFSEKMWPEFGREDFDEALRVYRRETGQLATARA